MAMQPLTHRQKILAVLNHVEAFGQLPRLTDEVQCIYDALALLGAIEGSGPDNLTVTYAGRAFQSALLPCVLR